MSFVTSTRAAALRRFWRTALPLTSNSNRTVTAFGKNNTPQESSLLSCHQRRLLLQRPSVVSIPPVRGFAGHPDGDVVGFDEFKGCLHNQAYMVVDVREPKELAEDGKLIGAINIPLGQVDAEFTRPPKHFITKYHQSTLNEEGENIIFFCRAGVRAEKAMKMAHKHGYTMARFYKGSFNEWVERGEPVVK